MRSDLARFVLLFVILHLINWHELVLPYTFYVLIIVGLILTSILCNSHNLINLLISLVATF